MKSDGALLAALIIGGGAGFLTFSVVVGIIMITLVFIFLTSLSFLNDLVERSRRSPTHRS